MILLYIMFRWDVAWFDPKNSQTVFLVITGTI